MKTNLLGNHNDIHWLSLNNIIILHYELENSIFIITNINK